MGELRELCAPLAEGNLVRSTAESMLQAMSEGLVAPRRILWVAPRTDEDGN